ncbi:MAG: hypothetical protein FWD80_05830 [Propionibacteriaceae bacterium]|nr:hypothetical protein [Propionibacteriaceae bacterium]
MTNCITPTEHRLRSTDDGGAGRHRVGWWTRLMASVVVLGLTVTGCTSSVLTTQEVSGSSSPSATMSINPTDMTSDQLYDLAVSQYYKLFEILKDVNAQNGMAQLPTSVDDYLVDPAWTAINDMYSDLFFSGDHYVDVPNYQITAIAPLTDEPVITDAVVAIQACELIQGAAMVDDTGMVLQDGSPVIKQSKAYFAFDQQTGDLKVFVLNGKGVDTCPINA